MDIFDEMFGGMFDLNGDGETTMEEMLIANKIISDSYGKENRLFDDPFENYDDDEE